MSPNLPVSTMRKFVLVPKHGPTVSIGSCEYGLALGAACQAFAKLSSDAVIYAFQRLPGWETDYLEYDSATRLTLPEGVAEVACVAVQAGATYGDLVLWDLAHALPLDGILTTLEPAGFDDCVLDRAYFSDVFERTIDVVGGWHVGRYRKVALTRSELEAGLEDWTFGLPVGRATPALLAKLTTDIERLGLDKWELLLAVSQTEADASELVVPANVVIIPCGDATISQKKNVIATTASYKNLCIFHDRVELPRNFRMAIERFGDHYGLCGFQQLFFDAGRDTLERYSDYHTDLGDGCSIIRADGPSERGRLYSEALDARLRFRAHFAEAHPAEYDRKSYLTGSLYLAKRSLWTLVEQNPAIEWNELEDVEFGGHAIRAYGIPSRINPHAFGFTSRVRAVLLGSHEVADRNGAGSTIRLRSGYASQRSSGNASGLDQFQIRQRAWALFEEFGLMKDDISIRNHIFYSQIGNEREYANYWVRILYRLALPRRRGRIEHFLALFSMAAFGFAYDKATHKSIMAKIQNGAFFVDEIIKDNYFIRSMENVQNLVNRHEVDSGEALYAQTIRLWRRGGDYVYPYRSFSELWAVMRHSLGSEGGGL